MEVSLALGGGGVRGAAHLGVIQFLERNGFQVRAIAGTSAGGMVGAIYAAGYSPEQIEKFLTGLDQSRLYTRLPGDGPSLMGLGGVVHALTTLLGERDFSDLHLPLVVTAVDLENGQLCLLNQGQVLEAVLATIAVPGIFPPRQYQGRMLVDGGVLNPIPVAAARALAPGLPVVAVALSPAVNDWIGPPQKPRFFGSVPLLNRVNQHRLVQSFEIFMRSIDLAGCMLADLQLEMDKPEVLIRVEGAPAGWNDRINFAALAQAGEQAAARALPSLREASGWRRLWAVRLPRLSNLFQGSDDDS